MNSSSDLTVSSRAVWSPGLVSGTVQELVPAGVKSLLLPLAPPRATTSCVLALEGCCGLVQVDADQLVPELTTERLDLQVSGSEGHLEAVLSPGQRATITLADAFLRLLDEHQAINYLEMSLAAHGSDGRQVLVTCVRRPEGLTPHQKASHLETRVRQLEALLTTHQIAIP